MAEHHSGPAETGAPMDYREHEKTYNLFIAGAKYGTVMVGALMIAMAAGLVGGAGFVLGFLIFVVLSALGILLVR